ncbi:MAG: helix-turn-helix transcriptional regulator [Cyanobacteria bacterium P01_F01_bin.150]
MACSLQTLFDAINHSKIESDLQTLVLPSLGRYFSAKRWGLFFLDSLPIAKANHNLQKALQVGLSIERNPVIRYLVERHSPVHEEMVVSPKIWTTICPRPDHWHVMAGPIVGSGQLEGIVGFTRDRSMPAFDTRNLGDLSAVCLHLSVWSSTMRSQYHLLKIERLTPRERQIAELVALGHTNAEIGIELWITENSVKQALKRMFRKLNVSSRTEMVAQLFVNKAQFTKPRKTSTQRLRADF